MCFIRGRVCLWEREDSRGWSSSCSLLPLQFCLSLLVFARAARLKVNPVHHYIESVTLKDDAPLPNQRPRVCRFSKKTWTFPVEILWFSRGSDHLRREARGSRCCDVQIEWWLVCESILRCSRHFKAMRLKANALCCVCAFSRAVRTHLLSFEGQTEVILTKPWSLGAHLSIPISFLGCPNSVSSFLGRRWGTVVPQSAAFSAASPQIHLKVMHHKVLRIRLH